MGRANQMVEWRDFEVCARIFGPAESREGFDECGCSGVCKVRCGLR